jgi:hypothetical protein
MSNPFSHHYFSGAGAATLVRILWDFKPSGTNLSAPYTMDERDVGISYGSFGYEAQSDSKNGQAIAFNTINHSGIELA